MGSVSGVCVTFWDVDVLEKDVKEFSVMDADVPVCSLGQGRPGVRVQQARTEIGGLGIRLGAGGGAVAAVSGQEAQIGVGIGRRMLAGPSMAATTMCVWACSPFSASTTKTPLRSHPCVQALKWFRCAFHFQSSLGSLTQSRVSAILSN